ncbi:PBP1A family penicillin-binding protein [Candidatus Fermentibacteria bacterium]|nr:PBP1A family penicillin-binding protein [Candidatus Fermentibacteria bacterium]
MRRIVFAALFTTCALAVVVFGILGRFSSDLPPVSALEQPPQVKTTRILSADDEVLYEFYTENRIVLRLDQVSPWLVDGFLAMEDTEFRSHWGLNLRRLVGALIADIKERRFAQGASTLTQQLARSLYLSNEKIIPRKIKEALLALRIERLYTKDEILTMYLNQIWLGEGTYGVEAAAQEYFAKSAADLKPEEAATLVAVAANASLYSPRRKPDNCLARRNRVLQRMARVNVISQARADSLKALPLGLGPDRSRPTKAPYFVDYVRRQVVGLLGTDALMTEGLVVHTTLDYHLQSHAESVVEQFLTAKEKTQGYRFKRSDGDSAGYVQSALVLMDTATGHIRAFMGGRDFYQSQFNRAIDAPRQPGSAFKPIVYTAAVDNGFYPSSFVMDSPIVLPLHNDVWRPRNFDGQFKGKITLRHALRESRNVCSVRLLEAVGVDQVIQYARRFGLTTPLVPVPSIAIGSVEVKILEMVRAYSVFANTGLLVEPVFITRIERNGALVYSAHREVREAIDPRTAFIMTSLLESVVKSGTGASIAYSGFKRPAAGKTGTTNDCSDAWFVGFTPDYVCGVWTGFDLRLSLGLKQTGAVAALPMWIDVMKAAHEGLPPRSFSEPPGIVRVTVCTRSGELSGPRCPEVIEEVFREGDEPKIQCTVHQAPDRVTTSDVSG